MSATNDIAVIDSLSRDLSRARQRLAVAQVEHRRDLQDVIDAGDVDKAQQVARELLRQREAQWGGA